MSSQSMQPTIEVRVKVSRKAWNLGCFSADYWRVGGLFIFTSALALPFGARFIVIVTKTPDVRIRVALAWKQFRWGRYRGGKGRWADERRSQVP